MEAEIFFFLAGELCRAQEKNLSRAEVKAISSGGKGEKTGTSGNHTLRQATFRNVKQGLERKKGLGAAFEKEKNALPHEETAGEIPMGGSREQEVMIWEVSKELDEG